MSVVALSIRLSNRAGFILASLLFTGVFAAAAAPSPLYQYQQTHWGFASGLIPIAFATYAGTLLASLLTVGSLADHLGRRPVIVTGMLVEAGAMVLFMSAPSIELIIAARAVQGAAMGALVGALGSCILSFAPRRSATLGPLVTAFTPQAGSALGAIGAGWIIGWAIEPSIVIYAAFLLLFVTGAALSMWLPGDTDLRPGALASLAPRVAIPKRARREFTVAIPIFAAGWMLGALYLSLVPKIVHDILGQESAWVGGTVIGLFCSLAAVSGIVGGRFQAKSTAYIGAMLMALGAAALAAAVWAQNSSLVFFGAGTIVSGIGFGLANAGSLRVVLPLAEPNARAGLFSAVYLVSYGAFGIPIVAAGALIGVVGLVTVITWYSLTVSVLAVLSLFAQRATSRKTLPPAQPSLQTPQAAVTLG